MLGMVGVHINISQHSKFLCRHPLSSLIVIGKFNSTMATVTVAESRPKSDLNVYWQVFFLFFLLKK